MSERALSEIRRLTEELTGEELRVAYDILKTHRQRLDAATAYTFRPGDRVKMIVDKRGLYGRIGTVTHLNRTTVNVTLDARYPGEPRLGYRMYPSSLVKVEGKEAEKPASNGTGVVAHFPEDLEMPQLPQFHPGDRVMVNLGKQGGSRKGTVDRVNPRTVSVTLDRVVKDDIQLKWRVDYSFLTKLEGDAAKPAAMLFPNTPTVA